MHTTRQLIPTSTVQVGTVLLDPSGRPRTVAAIEPYRGDALVPMRGVAVSADGYRVSLTAAGHIMARVTR